MADPRQRAELRERKRLLAREARERDPERHRANARAWWRRHHPGAVDRHSEMSGPEPEGVLRRRREVLGELRNLLAELDDATGGAVWQMDPYSR